MDKNIQLLVENIFDDIDDMNSDDSLLNTITMSAVHQKQEEIKRIIKWIETGNNDELRKIAIGDFMIPEGTTKIGIAAFAFCKQLTSITIPDTVININNSAFQYCPQLKFIKMSKNIKEIGDLAFANCGINSITIPEDVRYMGKNVFTFDNNLTSVNWNAKNCTIYSFLDSPFYNTNILNFEFGNNVEIIPQYLCYDLDNLTNIIIPDSVTTIGDCAFYKCKKLSYITIGKSVTSIGRNAFSYCYNLTSINIPQSVIKMDLSMCSSKKALQIIIDVNPKLYIIVDNEYNSDVAIFYVKSVKQKNILNKYHIKNVIIK